MLLLLPQLQLLLLLFITPAPFVALLVRFARSLPVVV
jgi:hypothetical protein